MERGLVLGCGGTVGGAWQVGALAAIARAWDWDPRTASVIVGTSCGASLAAMLGAGVGVDELLAAHHDDPAARPSARRFCAQPPAPRPALPFGRPSWRLATRRRGSLMTLAGLAPAGRTDPAFLDDLVDDLIPNPAVRLIAVDADTGERVAFKAPEVPLRDAVRASWAVPGWYPPVTIDGRRYLDGGVTSTASADLAAGLGLDEVVVIAPMASTDGARVGGLGGRLESLLRKPMSRGLVRETALLASTGVRVTLLCPSAAELAVMGPNFMDPRRRLLALRAALARQGALR
ncbi:patatin-like phospholipase family protein [Kutzneria sp. CA-103260]|uniref:patatin-like phospholipase family protein n=1 Tax=Kutzneria sp. CA-103260 TaxID=2802641 RepID=UPI001BABFC8F|nr:patatin-like phospholipase family protein [Kutzneria sp. CA-103260]QUQ72139.1 patatin-like phospholipase family protein [Kutzneria sp. CA-103260]